MNGKVIDPTLRVTGQPYTRIRSVFPPDWAYWGVEMQPQACEHALQHDTGVALIDDYECGWPLIPGRHPALKRRLTSA